MNDEVTVRLEKDIRKTYIRRFIIIVICIICLALLIGFIFTSFKKYSDARLALREAKNIKMSLEVADMEYYSVGLNIYDDSAEGNIRKAVLERIKNLHAESDGFVRLTGYDSEKRKITGFEYENPKYIIRYSAASDGDKWQIFQIKELIDY